MPPGTRTERPPTAAAHPSPPPPAASAQQQLASARSERPPAAAASSSSSSLPQQRSSSISDEAPRLREQPLQSLRLPASADGPRSPESEGYPAWRGQAMHPYRLGGGAVAQTHSEGSSGVGRGESRSYQVRMFNHTRQLRPASKPTAWTLSWPAPLLGVKRRAEGPAQQGSQRAAHRRRNSVHASTERKDGVATQRVRAVWAKPGVP